MADKNEEIERLKTTVKRLEGQRDDVFNDLLRWSVSQACTSNVRSGRRSIVFFVISDTDLFSLRMQKEKSTAKNEQILLTKNLEEIKKTHLQPFLGII